MKLVLAGMLASLLYNLQCSQEVDLHSDVPSSCEGAINSSYRVVQLNGTEILIIGQISLNEESFLRYVRGEDYSSYYINTGGVYLFPEPVPYNVTVTAALAVGLPGDRFNETLDSDPLIPTALENDISFDQFVAPFLYYLVYRPTSNENGSFYTLSHNLHQNIIMNNRTVSPPNVQKGDYVGVYIPYSCVNRSSDGLLQCPSQINFVTNTCHSALYHPALNGVNYLPVNELKEVSVFLNMHIEFSPNRNSSEISPKGSTGVIIPSTVTSAAVVTFLFTTVAVVIVIKKLKARKLKKFASFQQQLHVLPLSFGNHDYTGSPSNSVKDTATSQNPAKRVRVGSKFVRDMSKMDLVIPARNIKLLDTVGKGEFGVVYKGHLTEWKGRSAPELVAVKTLKDILSPKDIKDLINESETMTKFDHLNVLSLIGVCIDAGEAPYLVMPYMANGSLLKYLRKERPQLTIKENTSENSMQVADVTEKLLSICFQIAQGMCYLAENKFLHRDLAARNCMISENFVIKVADFGLAEDIYCCDYFRQNHVSGAEEAPVKLPVKWMALESLLDDIFTEKTDVWSYGVTCWEVFSLGRTPYPGVDPFSLIKFLKNGGRLEKPSNPACSDQVFSIIEKCWDEVPDKRSSFKELESALEPLLADKGKQWAAK